MAFWKPGAPAPGSFADRDTEREVSDTIIPSALSSSRAYTSAQERFRLPIYRHRDQLLYLLEQHQVLVIVGETGSGKTTQLPQYLYEAGWAPGRKMIACTQPRRIAATTVARRVAEEMGVQLGQEVGYTVRFDDCSHPNLTHIKYMTDGMLFREAFLDPLLSRYSVIMVDEAHERSLYTDVLVGVLKKILRKRDDLRIIISSATLDAKLFCDFFNQRTSSDPAPSSSTQPEKPRAVVMSIEGRQFPVEVQYLREPCSDYLEQCVSTVMQIHQKEPPGDILVFLTGRDEIDTAVERIVEEATMQNQSSQLLVLPLYGDLPLEQQLKVFEPPTRGVRKVVVATNVAETSVTIDGIVYVIDSGFAKIRVYNPRTGMDSLMVVPVSQASANQRVGRAGRTQPGKGFRIYTEDAFCNSMSKSTVPEVQRTNLATIILQLKALGIDNVIHFEYLSPPPPLLVTRALELLYSLKALDDYGRLTMPFGLQLAEMPLDPMLATMLLNSPIYGCVEEALTICAMLSVQQVFVTPSGARREADEAKTKFSVEEGDHISFLNVYNAFLKNRNSPKWSSSYFLNHRALTRSLSIRQQLKKYMKRFGIDVSASCGGDTVALRKCIVSGYFSHAAKLMPDGRYRTLKDGVVSCVSTINPRYAPELSPVSPVPAVGCLPRRFVHQERSLIKKAINTIHG
ncbi:hypothetical protein HK102_003523 [Quaeritorhiza haematococci]|nr:hypothetical protein HK102_003523 [Quaeritorhiza haematococci]